MRPLLAISDLSVAFATERGHVQALDGVSIDVMAGETLAIVGESGSGKSVTALSILGLLGDSGQVKAGKIEFEGEDLSPVISQWHGCHCPSMIYRYLSHILRRTDTQTGPSTAINGYH